MLCLGLVDALPKEEEREPDLRENFSTGIASNFLSSQKCSGDPRRGATECDGKNVRVCMSFLGGKGDKEVEPANFIPVPSLIYKPLFFFQRCDNSTWVVQDFTSTRSGEVSVSRGQQVELLDPQDAIAQQQQNPAAQMVMVRILPPPTEAAAAGGSNGGAASGSSSKEGLVPAACLKLPPPAAAARSHLLGKPDHEGGKSRFFLYHVKVSRISCIFF